MQDTPEDLREEWKNEVAKNYVILHGFVPAQNHIADWWLSKCIPKSTLRKFIEESRREHESEDFNDGGDEEYRDRRIQIQTRTVNAYNQALSDLKKLLEE